MPIALEGRLSTRSPLPQRLPQGLGWESLGTEPRAGEQTSTITLSPPSAPTLCVATLKFLGRIEGGQREEERGGERGTGGGEVLQGCTQP